MLHWLTVSSGMADASHGDDWPECPILDEIAEGDYCAPGRHDSGLDGRLRQVNGKSTISSFLGGM